MFQKNAYDPIGCCSGVHKGQVGFYVAEATLELLLLLPLPPNFLDYRNPVTTPTVKRVMQVSFKLIFSGVAPIVYI